LSWPGGQRGAGQERVVPAPRDLVQREPQQSRLLHGDVEPGHGDAGEPEAAGCDQALVAANDCPILAAREHRLDEAELAQAPFERVELVLADATRVGGVRPEEVDGDLFDGEGRGHGNRGHGSAPFLRGSARVR
jgi:hypothetical protein